VDKFIDAVLVQYFLGVFGRCILEKNWNGHHL